ncbi:MAG: hypothetical protein IPP37_18940 [Saprospiraceae bacterium]|nr:hypothetical protein [Saprospiraceae bacterium]MBL0084372.1 hypothetical protein [Saprospiraceae bacterium]
MRLFLNLGKKTIMKSIKLFFISLLLSILVTFSILAQKKLSLIVGAGFPELYHVGTRYQIKQSQLGISLGLASHFASTFTADYLYHYSKESSLSSRKVWYMRWNYTLLKEKDEYEIIKTHTLGMRIGRELNITKSFGIGLDAGLVFRLYEDTILIKPKPLSGWNFNFGLGFFEIVLPAIGIHSFYKF